MEENWIYCRLEYYPKQGLFYYADLDEPLRKRKHVICPKISIANCEEFMEYIKRIKGSIYFKRWEHIEKPPLEQVIKDFTNFLKT